MSSVFCWTMKPRKVRTLCWEALLHQISLTTSTPLPVTQATMITSYSQRSVTVIDTHTGWCQYHLLYSEANSTSSYNSSGRHITSYVPESSLMTSRHNGVSCATLNKLHSAVYPSIVSCQYSMSNTEHLN